VCPVGPIGPQQQQQQQQHDFFWKLFAKNEVKTSIVSADILTRFALSVDDNCAPTHNIIMLIISDIFLALPSTNLMVSPVFFNS
jgi:hypothetical protein